MIRVVISFICILLCILDNSLIPSFGIKGIYPNLLYTFIISYSLLKKKEDAVFIGVLSGFLQDIYFSNVFGINCLFNLLLCILASAIGETIVKNKRLVPILSMFALTMLKYGCILIVFYFSDMKMGLNIIQMICASIENAVITFFIYNYIAKKIEENSSDTKWGFR